MQMAEDRIPKREEIAEEYTWDLRDMFPDDAAWTAEYEALKDMPARIAAYRGCLGESAEELLGFFQAPG